MRRQQNRQRSGNNRKELTHRLRRCDLDLDLGTSGHTDANFVVPALSCQRRLATACRVIEIEIFELARRGRCDSQIVVGQPLRRFQDFFQDRLVAALESPVAGEFA